MIRISKHFHTFELHFTKTQHELIDTEREFQKKVVGGQGIFKTSKPFLEKQQSERMYHISAS